MKKGLNHLLPEVTHTPLKPKARNSEGKASTITRGWDPGAASGWDMLQIQGAGIEPLLGTVSTTEAESAADKEIECCLLNVDDFNHHQSRSSPSRLAFCLWNHC